MDSSKQSEHLLEARKNLQRNWNELPTVTAHVITFGFFHEALMNVEKTEQLLFNLAILCRREIYIF